MHKVKSHKSVEEIAKKHRLEVSFVKKQLEMGIPIEHEHTKDRDLATDIALQHLDEIPDYYTRLKKMESSAKKEHKKFKDVKEYIELLDENKKDGKSAKDPGYSLRDWFKGGGWVQAGGKYDGKPCAKQPGQKTKPFCRDADDRASMSKKERSKRSAKKRKEDPNPNRSGAAKIVTKEEYIQEKKGEKDACYHKVKSRYKIWPSAYASGALVKCRKVGADNWGTKSEACWDGYEQKGMKKKGKKMVPNCTPVKESTIVRYCPKCKKEETRDQCKYGERYWDMFSMPIKLKDYTPNTPHPGNFPESKQYDHEYSMARSELATIASAVKRLKKKMKGEGNIEAWVQSKITKAADYIDTAADYVDSGEMSEGKKETKKQMQVSHYELFGDLIYEGDISNITQEEIQFVIDTYDLEGEQLNEFLGALLKLGAGAAGKLAKPIGKAITNVVDRTISNTAAKAATKTVSKGASEIKGPKITYDIKPSNVKYGGGTATKPSQPTLSRSQAQRALDDDPWTRGAFSRDDVMRVRQDRRALNDEYEYSNWRSDFGLSEDWQKVNRQDRTDGLSQKAVNAYRREHPGSKLKTAVTEKNPKGKRAKRRSNFCSRMSGMKAKLTSSKTANDPDSRINKALRRWRCEEYLPESVNIAGDFNGNLYMNGSDSQPSVKESFIADVVWEGKIYRMQIEGKIMDKTKLAEQLQGEYPGAIVHNIYPQSNSPITIKSSQRYRPERLSWSD